MQRSFSISKSNQPAQLDNIVFLGYNFFCMSGDDVRDLIKYFIDLKYKFGLEKRSLGNKYGIEANKTIRRYIEIFPYIMYVILYYKKRLIIKKYPDLSSILLNTLSELKSGKINRKSCMKFGLDPREIRNSIVKSIFSGDVRESCGIKIVPCSDYYSPSSFLIDIHLEDSVTGKKITKIFRISKLLRNECEVEEVYEEIRAQYLDESTIDGYILTNLPDNVESGKVIYEPLKTYEIFNMADCGKNGFSYYKEYCREFFNDLQRESDNTRLFKIKAQFLTSDTLGYEKEKGRCRKISIVEELNPKRVFNELSCEDVEVTKYNK